MLPESLTQFITPQTIAAIILTALISPLISPITTRLYVKLRLLPSPSVSASMRDAEQPFQAGKEISRYDGIEWESRFRVYRLTIANNGKAEAKNLKAKILFPGVVETFKKREPTGIDYEIHDPAWSDTVVNGVDQDVNKCGTKHVWIDSLPSGQRVFVDFIVNHEPLSSEGFKRVNPLGDSTVNYQWTVRSTTLSDEVFLSVDDELKQRYEEFAEYLINDGPRRHDEIQTST